MAEEEYPGEDELVSRAPTPQDLANLCRHLNDSGARYVVVGGFAIRGAGDGRETMDLNLEPGEIAKYTVVRVSDETCVDLMASRSPSLRPACFIK